MLGLLSGREGQSSRDLFLEAAILEPDTLNDIREDDLPIFHLRFCLFLMFPYCILLLLLLLHAYYYAIYSLYVALLLVAQVHGT